MRLKSLGCVRQNDDASIIVKGLVAERGLTGEQEAFLAGKGIMCADGESMSIENRGRPIAMRGVKL